MVNQQKSQFLLILLFLLIAVNINTSLADGCFFYDVEKIGNSAESPNQRALIIHDGEKQTMLVQVKYAGTLDKFAWVVPVPARPEQGSLTTVPDDIFQTLHDKTQPRVYKFGQSGWNYKLGGSRGDGFADMPTEPEKAVVVWESLQVGPYDMAVLSGASSQALIDWLQTHGYDFPSGAQDVLNFYIQKNWYFVASRVQIDGALGKNNSTYQAGLPALKMTFATNKPVFPLRISELTSAKENEIELYVVAPHRMVSDTYNTVSLEREQVQESIEAQIAENNTYANTGVNCACKRVMEPTHSETLYDYEAIFKSKLDSYPEPTFLVESVREQYSPSDDTINFREYFPTSTYYLTRLRTILSRTR